MAIDKTRFNVLLPSDKSLVLAFKKDIADRAKEVDPKEERDWYDLSIGYFLAKGTSVDVATNLSLIIRYDLQYWC